MPRRLKILASWVLLAAFLATAAPVFVPLLDSNLGFSDITTGNVTSTKHGFRTKLTNVAYSFFDETGTVRSNVAYTGCETGTASGTTNVNAETNVAICSIPAGTLGPNGHLAVTALYKFTGGAGVKSPWVRYSATSADTAGGFLIGGATGGAVGNFEAHLVSMEFWNANSASAQVAFNGLSVAGMATGQNTSVMVAGAVNTANPSYVNFNCQTANAGDTCGLVGGTITVNYGP